MSSRTRKIIIIDTDRVAADIQFHVLFNASGGHVQECFITASCLLECEDRLRELHPEAVYWEIGADSELPPSILQSLLAEV